MRRFRKCDTEKYRRCRQHEKVAHAERVSRRHREDAALATLHRKQLDEYMALKSKYQEQEQKLVNVVAARLYQLSPEHAAQAHLSELGQVFRMWTRGAGIFSV